MDVTADAIAVLGESMGGEEAIGALAVGARILAVVGEGVTGRVVADRRWLAKHLAGYMMRAEAWVTYATTDLLSGASEPPSLSASLPTAAPTAGHADRRRGRVARNLYLQRASPSNVRVLELPDTPHTAGLRTYSTLWTEKVTDFLEGVLGASR